MPSSAIPYTALGIGLTLIIILFQHLWKKRARPGAGGGTARNGGMGSPIEYVCATCGRRFSRMGRWAPDNPAVGGARCRSCGTFYCDRCANSAVPVGAEGRKLRCKCRASFVTRDAGGEWSFHNFDELVVFPVPRIERVFRSRIAEPLTQELLQDRLQPGHQVLVAHSDAGFVFETA